MLRDNDPGAQHRLPEDAAGIAARACEIDEQYDFHIGLSRRLNALGVSCTPDDRELMLEEVKRRYRSRLGISCPRTVQEWVRDTTPGTVNRRNNYELCMALELDFEGTADFFYRWFMTAPWCCKSRTDAVFLYCISHGRPYSAAARMLDEAQDFVPQEEAHTDTLTIFQTIVDEIDDDEQFMEYLSRHCYGNEQQFQIARARIIEETDLIKQRILSDGCFEAASPDRLNSAVIGELMGWRYQPDRNSAPVHRLPKRYTASLPNDVTLGKILGGSTASYETLRKTLMLMHFYNFYSEAENLNEQDIESNAIDFAEELNEVLESCGMAPSLNFHPFDMVLLCCSHTLEPIVTFFDVNERN